MECFFADWTRLLVALQFTDEQIKIVWIVLDKLYKFK